MNAAETIARAFAKAVYRNRFGDHEPEERERAWVNRHWPKHDSDARQLLRSLKGQPPHIIDAGMTGGPVANLGRPHDPNYVLDAQLEAMARS